VKKPGLPELPSRKFDFKTGSIPAGAVHIVPLFKDSDAGISILKGEAQKLARDFLKRKTFSGKAGEVCDLSPRGVILVGLGPQSSFHPDTLCSAMASIAPRLLRASHPVFALHLHQELAVALNGPENGQEEDEEETYNDYRVELTETELVSHAVHMLVSGAEAMESLKTESQKDKNKKDKPVVVYVDCPFLKKTLSQAVQRGADLGEYVNRMRFVECLPGNYFHPDAFESYTRQIAKEHSLSLKVIGFEELARIGCGGIVAVGQGSRIPPRMMVLEYKGKGAKNTKPLVLAGKGITFDTGGISLKPAGEMHEMKFDMCGAAIVVHALALASHRKLPVHVVGIVGIAENMPGGNAIKPGDVLAAYNGVTVEIQNTDAEGRLVLADVLSYACKHLKPAALFDFATLTGACVVALGHETAGVMTPDDSLAGRIDSISRKSLDRTWRLPHWKQYGQGLKSDIADLRNVSGRDGGTITAFRFLSRFVERKIPWAHFDIAGVAWHSKGFGTRTKGASGWGLAFLNRWFEEMSS
jgi:leucyl aminopeptidase